MTHVKIISGPGTTTPGTYGITAVDGNVLMLDADAGSSGGAGGVVYEILSQKAHVGTTYTAEWYGGLTDAGYRGLKRLQESSHVLEADYDSDEVVLQGTSDGDVSAAPGDNRGYVYDAGHAFATETPEATHVKVISGTGINAGTYPILEVSTYFFVVEGVPGNSGDVHDVVYEVLRLGAVDDGLKVGLWFPDGTKQQNTAYPVRADWRFRVGRRMRRCGEYLGWTYTGPQGTHNPIKSSQKVKSFALRFQPLRQGR